MKISIENFKSIQRLHEFEIKPMTVLSGVNSSGKSSFVQFLLLLKQTLEKSSTASVLELQGAYYYLRNATDAVFGQDVNNEISFGITLDSNEINLPNFLPGSRQTTVLVHFRISGSQILISRFAIHISPPENSDDTEKYFKLDLKGKHTYEINLNLESFGNNLKRQKSQEGIVDFVSIFPLSWQTPETRKELFTFDWVKEGVDKIFKSIFYIGPSREDPKYEYSASNTGKWVGIRGGHTAQIFMEFTEEAVVYHSIKSENQELQFHEKQDTLIEAVNYWLCDVCKVGGRIFAEKIAEVYRIILEDENGLKTNIKHVGYGISQVLPIIVQGLLMPNDGILIIEQPEIHLHPKIQSSLYDFLYSLTLQGKRVIVETHSSHFITRMRRRIAEDQTNRMDDRINLTFIEVGLFRTLELDDYGTLDYYPDNFIDSMDSELSAIVKAQMKKRKHNR
ncbi:MAG: AAA family ATPase [Bacteroidota bacterium]